MHSEKLERIAEVYDRKKDEYLKLCTEVVGLDPNVFKAPVSFYSGGGGLNGERPDLEKNSRPLTYQAVIESNQ